jgi:hypothetical protein
MRKTIVFSLLLIVALGSLESTRALGQCYSGFGQGRWWGSVGCRSGVSNLIQAAGYYNLNTSQAAINYETARSMNLENQLKRTQTFFEMRRINAASQQAEKRRGMTSEEAWHYAHLLSPKPLTATELDPVTGKIHWPMTLQDPRYDKYRDQIDHFFVLRATSYGGNFENVVQYQQVIQSFLVDLKDNIEEYRSDEYVGAKNFLNSLGFEAKSPTATVVSLR